MRFRFFVLGALASILLAAPQLRRFPSGHPRAGSAATADASAARASDLATVQTAFSSPEATRAATALGVDLAATSARLGTLDDAELHDLAVRAAALQSDPVAAGPFSGRQILRIVLIAGGGGDRDPRRVTPGRGLAAGPAGGDMR